jgi:ribosomal protein L16 Arg81 hydroxylase
VLYVPWGYPHDATSGESVSAHLVLGIRPPTWADVLSQVLSETLNEEILGESPGWLQSEEVQFKADFLSHLDAFCHSMSDPGKREAAAHLAWEGFIDTEAEGRYPTIAKIAHG